MIGTILDRVIESEMMEVLPVKTNYSSFEFENKLNERFDSKNGDFLKSPSSFSEMVILQGLMAEKRMIQHRLVYGYYPDVIDKPNNEKHILKQLVEDYIYNDLLRKNRIKIKRPDKFFKLLKAIAYNIGIPINYRVLNNLSGLSFVTIRSYLMILKQASVIIELKPFSRVIQQELTQYTMFYFYDNGIRNALISDFSDAESRSDIDILYKNLLISERIKLNISNGNTRRYLYWRITGQRMIDFLEESDGKICAYQFKWNPKMKVVIPKPFLLRYSECQCEFISSNNLESFLG
jgi:uncharacterized protein